MAITYGSRFGLPNWSVKEDTVSRQQFNDAFASIEANAAYDSDGTAATRPSPGMRGRYYFATDTKVLYRDTGSVWEAVSGTRSGTTSERTASSTTSGLATGTLYWDTSLNALFAWTGSAWSSVTPEVSWANVSGKPSIFPTNWSNVSGKPSTFAPSSHTHPISDLQAGTFDIDRIPVGTSSTTVARGNHTHAWGAITGKPTIFPTDWANVDGKPTTSTLDGRNITISSAAPSGGANGDIWFQY